MNYCQFIDFVKVSTVKLLYYIYGIPKKFFTYFIVYHPLNPIANVPTNLSFTGPIDTTQFDHNGGTFQSPIHKVSLVVPPNALSNGEKVTVNMGATTSGPFEFPENSVLRSAVVWLDVCPKKVAFKKNIRVTVPHSAIFSDYRHKDFMTCVICEDYNNRMYRFSYSSNYILKAEEERGCIEMNKLVMVAIVARYPRSLFSGFTYGDLKNPSARSQAKLFWPRGELPSSFRTYVYYIHHLPTELYKVNSSSYIAI